QIDGLDLQILLSGKSQQPLRQRRPSPRALNRPVDLAELVSGMNDLLRRSVGSSISIETILTATLPPALVDANQLELALLNLAV
ncbi:hypothetical protein, partial [Rhizobium johnstonii]|uniref:hypothetical protein n=1 Tax=Rhizobium johnstonii TaxID=3019933 RepID=UPI003F9D202A